MYSRDRGVHREIGGGGGESKLYRTGGELLDIVKTSSGVLLSRFLSPFGGPRPVTFDPRDRLLARKYRCSIFRRENADAVDVDTGPRGRRPTFFSSRVSTRTSETAIFGYYRLGPGGTGLQALEVSVRKLLGVVDCFRIGREQVEDVERRTSDAGSTGKWIDCKYSINILILFTLTFSNDIYKCTKKMNEKLHKIQ